MGRITGTLFDHRLRKVSKDKGWRAHSKFSARNAWSPKLAALDRAVTRLVDAYQAEVIERSELAERRRRIDDHGRMLRERIREIAQQRSERSAELRLLEGVDAFCPSLREAMEEPCLTVQPCGGGQPSDHRACRADRACSIANGTSCPRWP